MRTRGGHRALTRLGGVRVGGVDLVAPFMTASGTAGHDVEFDAYMPMSRLGATVVKSLFHEPWAGNPAPRVHMAGSSMINAVGLQGPGVDAWIVESLPRIRSRGVTCVVSIWGRTVEEYRAAARGLAVADGIAAIEVNLSCPNLEGRSGIIAHDLELSSQVVAAVVAEARVPVWAKLSANTDRLVDIAAGVSAAGAQALTLVNTMLGMIVDVDEARPVLGNGGGGLSGPAIHPIAVRAVHDVRVALPDVDIIGVGGVSSGRDALELMMAGAQAVQVGTASFADPAATWNIARSAALSAESSGARSWVEIVSAMHRR